MKNNNNNTLTKKGTNNNMTYVLRRNTTVLLTTTDLELVKFKFQLATQCNRNHSVTVREDSVTGLGKELASHNGRGNYTNNLQSVVDNQPPYGKIKAQQFIPVLERNNNYD